MKKSVLFGLALFAGLSNTANAAVTSLSTTGTWQEATGSLSFLLGESAPATWTYDTELSNATPIVGYDVHPSGGSYSIYGFEAPTYGISGTYGSLFDGNGFEAIIDDNFVEAIDFPGGTSFADAMEANGFSSYDTFDSLIFFTNTFVNNVSYVLAGYMLFDKDFFNGPISTLPDAASLLENNLFLFAEIGAHTDFDLIDDFRDMDGYASYSQVNVSQVPVPAAAYLLAPALLGFMGLRRRKSA